MNYREDEDDFGEFGGGDNNLQQVHCQVFIPFVLTTNLSLQLQVQVLHNQRADEAVDIDDNEESVVSTSNFNNSLPSQSNNNSNQPQLQVRPGAAGSSSTIAIIICRV